MEEPSSGQCVHHDVVSAAPVSQARVSIDRHEAHGASALRVVNVHSGEPLTSTQLVHLAEGLTEKEPREINYIEFLDSLQP